MSHQHFASEPKHAFDGFHLDVRPHRVDGPRKAKTIGAYHQAVHQDGTLAGQIIQFCNQCLAFHLRGGVCSPQIYTLCHDYGAEVEA
jgi:hypothetical protein